MATFNFQPIPSDHIGRRKYRVRYDSLGSNLPRKRQMFAEEIMSPTVIPYSPNNFPVGTDQKVPLMPGDSTK